MFESYKLAWLPVPKNYGKVAHIPFEHITKHIIFYQQQRPFNGL